jgi:hypothetical protein
MGARVAAEHHQANGVTAAAKASDLFFSSKIRAPGVRRALLDPI